MTLGKQLVEAVQNGDIEQCRRLLLQGVSPNSKDRGQTGLHVACDCNAPDCVTLLLDKGADTGSVDHSGMTPLHKAAINDANECITLLLQRGANINAVDNDGETALHKACLYGCSEAFVVLLQANPDLDIRNKEDPANYSGGSTALHFAATDGNMGWCERLVEGGANVNVRDVVGQTPLHKAAQGDNTKLVKLLLDHGSDPTALDGGQQSPEMVAATGPIRQLLQKASGTPVTKHSGTPSQDKASSGGCCIIL
eukprot:m.479876 g.479876  ORF g.479876 m.479876 type:complete len:253 (+) comp21625_c0_seq1:1153-1911(+)